MENTCSRDNLTEKLRRKQRDLGIETQEDFARLLGISQSQLSRMYSGERNPGAGVMMRVLELWPELLIPEHVVLVERGPLHWLADVLGLRRKA